VCEYHIILLSKVDFTVKNSKWAEQEKGQLWELPVKRFTRDISQSESSSSGVLSDQEKGLLLKKFYGSQLTTPPPPGGPHSFLLDSSKAIVNFDDKLLQQASEVAPAWFHYYHLKYPLMLPPKMGRRILVFGLQSSGASLVAYTLAQKSNRYPCVYTFFLV